MKRARDILTSDIFTYPEVERPTSVPLFQTSLFTFPTVEALEHAITDERGAYLYSRGNNPTVEAVEEKVAALEGAERAKLFSSGVAAIGASILSLVRSGDHIIIANDAYTWAQYITTTYLARFGVTATLVDASDLSAVEEAITAQTKVLYLESPGTLYLKVQ
ncbi:MAG TPA: aminotransferase class I/II-fold pyridoxal phosphate-dependent enzyme, partial [Sphaerochaeta sp.]|nr:aminotransferase class I/II-fold pyridoxal phosphate-dependent enzyme [Sphaerochaeta sp.]